MSPLSIDDLLDRPASEGARIRAIQLLDAARAARPRLDDNDDVEAVHDFRVALRRLRSLLKVHKQDLKGVKKLRGELGDVAALTGQARDAEVQLAWLEEQRAALSPRHRGALRWLCGQLEEKKQAGYAAARKDAGPAFDRLEPRARQRLSRYRLDLLGGGAATTLGSELAQLLEQQAAALADGLARVSAPTDEETAHETRIVAKQLRYLLEPLADSERVGEVAQAGVKALKGLQDVLGELHDAHVLGHMVQQALVDAASEQARRIGEAVLEGRDTKVERDIRPGLTAIAGRVRERRDGLYEEMLRRRGALEELTRDVALVAGRLRAPGGGNLHRYLLAGVPPLPDDVTELRIDEGEVPGTRLVERLRQTRRTDGTIELTRTVKLGRIEVEEICPEDLFRRLWTLTAGRRLRKRRYEVKEGDSPLVYRIDRYLDRDLVVGEVELPSDGTDVPLPPWLAEWVVRDVTGERYPSGAVVAPRRRSVAKRSRKRKRAVRPTG